MISVPSLLAGKSRFVPSHFQKLLLRLCPSMRVRDASQDGGRSPRRRAFRPRKSVRAAAHRFAATSPSASGKRRGRSGFAAEALPDLVRAAHRAIQFALALAGVSQPIAMPAQEITAGPVQLGDAPPADPAVHDARTDEIGPRSTVLACDADDADALVDVLPIAAADAYAVGEMQLIEFGAQVDPSDSLAIARPLPVCRTSRAAGSLRDAAGSRRANGTLLPWRVPIRSAFPTPSRPSSRSVFCEIVWKLDRNGDPESSEKIDRLRLPMLAPRLPTSAMQPGMSRWRDAKRNKDLG